MVCPSLEQVELPFPRTSSQNMTTALQDQRSLRIEAYAAIRPIYFFFDNDWLAVQNLTGDVVKIFVAGLDSRPCDVRVRGYLRIWAIVAR